MPSQILQTPDQRSGTYPDNPCERLCIYRIPQRAEHRCTTTKGRTLPSEGTPAYDVSIFNESMMMGSLVDEISFVARLACRFLICVDFSTDSNPSMILIRDEFDIKFDLIWQLICSCLWVEAIPATK